MKLLLCNFKAGIKRFMDCRYFSESYKRQILKTTFWQNSVLPLVPLETPYVKFIWNAEMSLTPIWLEFQTYESHKSFCVMYRKIQSETDLSLISRHLTHHKTLACSICSSFSYTVSPCTRSAIPKLSHQLKMISVPF